MAPLLGAAVDRVSLLDEVCVLATRREHLPLFALGVWRLEFGEVVVTPVEGELEPLEDADSGLIERFRVVTTRMLNAVEEFTPVSKTNGPVTSAPRAVVENRLILPSMYGASSVSCSLGPSCAPATPTAPVLMAAATDDAIKFRLVNSTMQAEQPLIN